jgi:type IV pilus assembly protein PilY1
VLRQLSGPARSVAADVALVDSDYDGHVDRAYAADVGGSVHRIDFESASGPLGPSGWTLTPLARLADAVLPRKFFYAPDVVLTRTFTGVLLGSGDREKPLERVGADRFYLLKDPRVGKGAPGGDWVPIADAALEPAGASGAFAQGCYVALDPGEKVVTAAATIAGTGYFSTNVPTPRAARSCRANLGEARAYEMPLFCKPVRRQVLTGGGLPPSPVVGILELTGTATGTRTVPFVIGGINARRSALEIKKVTPEIPVRRRRPYWYLESER